MSPSTITQTLGRRPPVNTPNDSSPSSSLSQLKPSRSRLPAQTKHLAEPRTPATLTIRRTANPTINLLSGLNSPAQTPLLTIKRDVKSRLPRVAPTPTTTTPGISNPVTKRLRVKKLSTFQPQTTTTTAPSSSSSLPLTPEPSITQPVPQPTPSTQTIDPDTTPKKKPSRALKPNGHTNSNPQLTSSKLPIPPAINRPAQQTTINFPSIVEEQTPRRPMTRARSKKILDQSTSSLAPSPPEPTGIPQIKRKPSRVMQLAQAFQQEQPPPTDGHSNRNMLGVTPQRRPSNASNSSIISPAGSLGANSPNISALAASLSKQHVHRDMISRARSARSSVTDMLRYSTMSTLGGLHWEDGAGEGLLTDPDETEAMVADISMSKLTPLKPAVQSAAIALASARANFLNIVQENEDQSVNELADKEAQTPKPATSRIKKRPSFGFLPPFATTPISRSRISGSGASLTSNSPLGQLVAHESQLAALSSSLEQSHQRELELQKEINKLSKFQQEHQHLHDQKSLVGKNKKLADDEREQSLVDEIRRLETELDDTKEINIELENSLDLLKFENLETLNKFVKLQEDHHQLLSQITPPSQSIIPIGNPSLPDDPDPLRFEKFKTFDHQLLAELSAIKDQLKFIQFIKISLALGSDLLP